jgi:hypothetical protein
MLTHQSPADRLADQAAGHLSGRLLHGRLLHAFCQGFTLLICVISSYARRVGRLRVLATSCSVAKICGSMRVSWVAENDRVQPGSHVWCCMDHCLSARRDLDYRCVPTAALHTCDLQRRNAGRCMPHQQRGQQVLAPARGLSLPSRQGPPPCLSSSCERLLLTTEGTTRSDRTPAYTSMSLHV